MIAHLVLSLVLIALAFPAFYAQDVTVVETQVSSNFYVYATQEMLDAVGAKSNALVMGVGTGMSVGDYSQVATVLVQKLGYFIVISDDNPHHLVKLAGSLYAAVFTSINSWFAENKYVIQSWLVGGHSASGMACVEAITNNWLNVTSGSIDGFVGFDPYEYKLNPPGTYNVPITSIIWTMSHGGFGDLNFLMYCIPNLDKSGKGFYDHATSTPNTCSNHSLFTFSDTTSHCVFTNKNCNGLCGSSGSVNRDETYHNIADSIQKFIDNKLSDYSSTPFSNVVYTSRQACKK